MSPELYIQLVSEGAKMPSYGSEYAAGMDICSCEKVVVPSHGRALVSTGISMSMSPGCEDKYYLRIAPRSGLAVKNGLTTGAGVIDSDYRGIIKVLLFNHGDEDFVVNPGDRIAQMIMERILRPHFVEVNSHEDASSSAMQRGTNGFGSTGLH
jgi:dUTP pyrophosphatase